MKKKLFTILFVAAIVLSLALSAYASSAYTKQATLNYRGISISINGEVKPLTDANGNVVEPFIIDGTTYLPVRGIAEALGLNVEWDNATSTVIITDATQEPTPSPTPSSEPLNTTLQNDLIRRLDLCISSAGYQADAAQSAINDAISRGMGRSSYVEGYRTQFAAAENDIANMQALKTSIANATTNDELNSYAVSVANYEAVY